MKPLLTSSLAALALALTVNAQTSTPATPGTSGSGNTPGTGTLNGNSQISNSPGADNNAANGSHPSTPGATTNNPGRSDNTAPGQDNNAPGQLKKDDHGVNRGPETDKDKNKPVTPGDTTPQPANTLGNGANGGSSSGKSK